MTGIVKTDQIQGAGSSTVTIPTGNTLNVADNLTVDTNTLHVDASNNKVGIGTTSPEETLEVVHATAPAIQLNRTNDGGFKSILRQQGNDFEIRGSSGSTKIYTGNADGDSSTARLIIDANGNITKPTQPAFFVGGLSGGNQNDVAVGSLVTVQYNTERFDQGSDYDTSNYTFTAPVTGKYYLHAQVYVNSIDTGASYYSLRIDTSNKDYISIYNYTHTDINYITFQIDVLADMDASDTATVGFLQPNGTQQTDLVDNQSYSFFCGHLVC